MGDISLVFGFFNFSFDFIRFVDFIVLIIDFFKEFVMRCKKMIIMD